MQLNLRVDRSSAVDDYRINTDVLENYRRQLEQYAAGNKLKRIARPAIAACSCPASSMKSRASDDDPHEDWPTIEPVIREALAAMSKMRAEEGVALAADLAHNGRQILEHLDAISRRIAGSYAVVPIAAHDASATSALGTERHGRAGRPACAKSPCSPTAATSPKKSSASAAICSSTKRPSCFRKAPAAS